MSRNRCTTECGCGFWNLALLLSRDPDRALITWEAYWDLIGWPRDGRGRAGYGYQSVSDYEYWRSQDDSWGSNRPIEGGIRTVFHYPDVPETERYRVGLLVCPLCLRRYAGHFVKQPQCSQPDGTYTEEPHYELSDTSYWASYNDEPGDSDIADVREVTAEFIVAAVNEKWARHRFDTRE